MRQRVLTSVLLAPFVLLAVFLSSPWPVFALCSITLFIALDEIRRLLKHKLSSFLPAISFLLMAQLLLTRTADPKTLVGIAFGLFVAGVLSAWMSARSGRPSPLGEALDGLWAAMPFLCLVCLHQTRLEPGPWDIRSPLLLVLLPVWAGDIAAIYVGRAIGRHSMAPSISPKKTWEGAGGNFLAATLVGWLVGLWIDVPLGWLCGLCAGTLGQVGDLFESYVKRRAGLKDSGTLLPGHGGIMDRVDSVLFTAPAVALIVLLG